MKRTLTSITLMLLAGTSLAEEKALAQSLSLEACIMQAIKRNPDLRSERLNVLINKEEVIRELADFGWKLEASTRYEDRDKPQNTRDATSIQSDGSISLGSNRIFSENNLRSRVALRKRLSSGAMFELGATHASLENTLTLGSTNSLFSPEHEVFMGFTISQPLLRGAGRDTNLAAVDLARLKVEASKMLTLVKAMNLVAEVAARYTDVVAAEENLQVKQANIDLAESLVERNKELVKSGKGVQADVTTAELAVYQRQDDFLVAQAQRVERLNALLALIDSKPDFKRQTRFVPVRGFHTGSDLTNKEALVNFALQNRLDVSYYGSVVKSARLNLMRSENAAKPELNLVGGAGLYGLDEEVHRAFEQAGDNQGSEWSIGVEFKMNLGKEEGDARIRTAEHQLRQSELGLRKTKTSIALEVDTAHSRVISAKQRLKTAIKARELAEQNLKTEQELLDQGKGDLYRVIERQQILGDTKTNVVATQALLSKSVVALWMSSGQLFERFGVTEEWINAIVYEGAPAAKPNENR